MMPSTFNSKRQIFSQMFQAGKELKCLTNDARTPPWNGRKMGWMTLLENMRNVAQETVQVVVILTLHEHRKTLRSLRNSLTVRNDSWRPEKRLLDRLDYHAVLFGALLRKVTSSTGHMKFWTLLELHYFYICPFVCSFSWNAEVTSTTAVLQHFVWDYPGELVSEG